MDGSAPNLVIAATDKKGKTVAKRAWNSQACEQLNAWLGGFEPILKRMNPHNFNWFLHVMLFYHTKKLQEKAAKRKDQDDEDENNYESGEEDISQQA